MEYEDKLTDMLESINGFEQTKARLDLYKFFQGRIETIRTRLWTTLTWLAAIQGATLGLMVKDVGLRTTTDGQNHLEIGQPVLAVLLSLFAAVLAYYMMYVAKDGISHIGSNMKLANISIGLYPNGSREFAFVLMRRLAVAAMIGDIALLLIGLLGCLVWLGAVDVQHIRIASCLAGAAEPASGTFGRDHPSDFHH